MLKKLIFVISLVGAMVAANAQRSLGDLVEQEGFGWIAGTWIGDDGSGSEIKVVYKWAAEKNAVMTTIASEPMTSTGMTAMCHKTGEIRYVAVTTDGASVTGTWDLVDGNPTLKVEWYSPSGDTGKSAYVHKKGRNNTLQVDVYEGYSADYPTGTPDASIRFTKQA